MILAVRILFRQRTGRATHSADCGLPSPAAMRSGEGCHRAAHRRRDLRAVERLHLDGIRS